MIATSAAFRAAVRDGYELAVRARVCQPGQSGTDPDGVEIPIVSGDVRLDSTARVRATIDLTTVWDWPTRIGGDLAPYGNEIFVERGMVLPDGTTEYVPLGYYRIQTIEQDDIPEGAVRITGSDRMAGVIDAKILRPIQFPAFYTYGNVIADLIYAVYDSPFISWDDFTLLEQLDRDNTTSADRYAFCDDLVRSLGKTWYWDYEGVLQIKTAPDPSMPVADIDAGGDGVLVEAKRQLSREGVYNAIMATGEAADEDPPPSVIAYDMNADSPTYWRGPFGHVPVPGGFTSPFITKVPQASATAQAELRKRLGLQYSVDFAAFPDPSLEVLDPIQLVYGTATAPEVHVLDTLTVPLTADQPMTGGTRDQTNLIIVTDQ